MHWQIHKDSTAHHAVAERLGQRLPVAIAIGCDSGGELRASGPAAGDIDEYLFAGFLRGERVEMVDCVTVPLQVPATRSGAGGLRRAGRALPEGPFGDHTGFYTPVEPFPVLHVECMNHARAPCLPLDHHVEAAAGGRSDRQGHRADLPAADQDAGAGHRRLRPAGGRRVSTTASSSPSTSGYPKHAQKVMNAIWGATCSRSPSSSWCRRRLRRARLPEVAFRAFGNVDYATTCC
jgi:4-hydroxy-3-polyprenylbenzoate decarboxylase